MRSNSVGEMAAQVPLCTLSFATLCVGIQVRVCCFLFVGVPSVTPCIMYGIRQSLDGLDARGADAPMLLFWSRAPPPPSRPRTRAHFIVSVGSSVINKTEK